MYQEESFKTQKVVYAHTRSDEAEMEYKMHCHDVYEFYYMISGNVEYLLGQDLHTQAGKPDYHTAGLFSRVKGTGFG